MIRTTIAMALLLGLFIHDSQAQSVDCWLTTPDRSALLTHQSPPLVFAPVDAGNTSDSTTIRIDAAGPTKPSMVLDLHSQAAALWPSVLGKDEPTVENYQAAVKKLYGSRAEEVLKFFPASSREEVMRSATDLATDRFLAYSTWRWIDLHGKTSGHPVYRYLYARQLPPMKGEGPRNIPFTYAPHSADIAYALGNLSVYDIYEWTPEDRTTSEIMQGYLVNFIRTGDPNGPGLAKWPGLQASRPQVMIIDEHAHQEAEKNLRRYVFLDSFYQQ